MPRRKRSLLRCFLCPPALPNFVAPLCEAVQVLVVFRVDRVPDVFKHFQENQGLYDVDKRKADPLFVGLLGETQKKF